MVTELETPFFMVMAPETLCSFSSMATTPPAIFSYSIWKKLSNTNFLLWKEQVEFVIKAHRLHLLLVSPQIPSQFLSLSNCDLRIENPKYTIGKHKIKCCFRGCYHLYLPHSWLILSVVSIPFKFGKKIHAHFTSQTKARAHQLHTELHKHRLLVEMGLTLLSHASLPMSFWDHAFHTAVYIINRLSSSVAPYFVPYSTLFHKESIIIFQNFWLCLYSSYSAL